ncbi:hypothetical protein QEN19_003891 [Hanseniaspora menglaensis]
MTRFSRGFFLFKHCFKENNLRLHNISLYSLYGFSASRHLSVSQQIFKNTNKSSTVSLLKAKYRPVSPGSDQFISCTIINKHGKITDIFKKFKKWEFLQQNELYPRDLRKIDSSNIDIIPSIAVKPGKCIIVNLLHIKALIKSDEVMIFDTASSDEDSNNANYMSNLLYELEGRLTIAPQNIHTIPFELQVLETIMMNILGVLDSQCKIIENECGSVLKNLENQIDREKLKDLLIKSKSLATFHQRCLLIRNVLDELLETDEDLQGMSLTLLINKDMNSIDMETLEKNSGNCEMMLETYYYQFNELVQRLDTLITNIKSTEDIVNIMLDANRNALLLFELKVTIYTLGFTIATLMPSFYGMNLKNFIEDSEYGFVGIFCFSCMMAYIITFFNFKALRSVTRLTLMNNHTGQKTEKHFINAENMMNKKLLKTKLFSENLKNIFKNNWFKRRSTENKTVNKLKKFDNEFKKRKIQNYQMNLKRKKPLDWFKDL